MAFNERTKTVYWIADKAIKHVQVVNPDYIAPSKGDVLLNLNNSNPSEIEIDSCRG